MPIRAPRLAVLLALPLATLAFLAASCGDKVQSGLTGMDIHVSFEPGLPIYKLRFSGWLGSAVAFAQEDRPDDARTPSAEGENLVILLPDSMNGSSVFIQVDGIDRGGAPLASGGQSVPIASNTIRVVEIQLGDPRICGDGEVHPQAELCDDGNSRSGDGCSSQCVTEDGWLCEGTPSTCRRCGDGVCSQGEDQCTCPDDCAGATCGDGLCCEAAGEKCSCPDDCGEQPCGDGVCCDGEDDCRADCGDCGNGRCELEKGEDECRCPDDCHAGEGECGNGSCCEAGGEDAVNCAPDCCQSPSCGDGACCPTENASECPEDCCAAPSCGDGVCCPTETAAGCPADCCENNAMCGDGVCCPGAEDADSCAEDCCGQDPPCGDGQCCPGEVCAPDGCEEECQSCGNGACTPCCDTCTGQDCTFACEQSCDCTFDCTAPGSLCDIGCTDSHCFVECGDSTKCLVQCNSAGSDVDAGIFDLGRCACRGPGCVLSCPGGDPLVCPDGVTVACTISACP